MPNWGEVLTEIQGTRIDNTLDIVRRKDPSFSEEEFERNIQERIARLKNSKNKVGKF